LPLILFKRHCFLFCPSLQTPVELAFNIKKVFWNCILKKICLNRNFFAIKNNEEYNENYFVNKFKKVYIILLLSPIFRTLYSVSQLFSTTKLEKIPILQTYLQCVKSNLCYRVCHGFRLTTQVAYFWVDLDPFWSEHHFLMQLGQYWKLAQA